MTVMDAKEFAQFYYRLDDAEPTTAQLTSVRKMFQEQRFKSATKVGKRWFINMSKEYPLLFPQSTAPETPVQTDTHELTLQVIRELLTMIEGGINGSEKSGTE